ncbi:uncharacterized protein MAM_07071 [Metarhizium album ARSEF 1941]|uniref:Uncharacterized protein n=1 Tax=Metarhizium album (strain ARSEF 1941) TaxID=1081103 RepID=A0A0B2WNF6_METAS|nr:uncharacterized protein MAM_07071 [Metarhizium album ARSEF 1941]KHN95022.1 hypothetical protein MAM_07071 [Metarhizium album ARSEF 1941]
MSRQLAPNFEVEDLFDASGLELGPEDVDGTADLPKGTWGRTGEEAWVREDEPYAVGDDVRLGVYLSETAEECLAFATLAVLLPGLLHEYMCAANNSTSFLDALARVHVPLERHPHGGDLTLLPDQHVRPIWNSVEVEIAQRRAVIDGPYAGDKGRNASVDVTKAAVILCTIVFAAIQHTIPANMDQEETRLPDPKHVYHGKIGSLSGLQSAYTAISGAAIGSILGCRSGGGRKTEREFRGRRSSSSGFRPDRRVVAVYKFGRTRCDAVGASVPVAMVVPCSPKPL